MLKNILSGSDCAKCKICCIFDKYDLWETPVVTEDVYNEVQKLMPEVRFVSKGNSRLFMMQPEDVNGEELYYCPMLDKSNGCMLGDKKPFDCRIWPYRVMELGGRLVISIASICPEMYKKPLKELVEELEHDGLGEKIFSEAEKCQDIIKPYQEGYPILKVKKEI